MICVCFESRLSLRDDDRWRDACVCVSCVFCVNLMKTCLGCITVTTLEEKQTVTCFA